MIAGTPSKCLDLVLYDHDTPVKLGNMILVGSPTPSQKHLKINVRKGLFSWLSWKD